MKTDLYRITLHLRTQEDISGALLFQTSNTLKVEKQSKKEKKKGEGTWLIINQQRVNNSIKVFKLNMKIILKKYLKS